jgi:hypothetical protein
MSAKVEFYIFMKKRDRKAFYVTFEALVW